LTDYYRMIAILEPQISKENNSDSTGLTLRRVLVWMQEPLSRLKVIAEILEICQGTKGGALLSKIYPFVSHGEPLVRDLAQRLMEKATIPFYTTLQKWVQEGELLDRNQEFMIATGVPEKSKGLRSSDPSAAEMWERRYRIREDMTPRFFSRELRNKVLLTGKTLNFVRDVCEDKEWYMLSAGATRGVLLVSFSILPLYLTTLLLSSRKYQLSDTRAN